MGEGVVFKTLKWYLGARSPCGIWVHMGYRTPSWSLVTSLHPSIPSLPAPFVFQSPDNLCMNFGYNSSFQHPFTLSFNTSSFFSNFRSTREDSDAAPQATFIHQIFKEHIIYARHSSRIWSQSSGRNKDVCCHRASILLATDKSLKWHSLDQMPPFGTITCSWEGEAGSYGTWLTGQQKWAGQIPQEEVWVGTEGHQGNFSLSPLFITHIPLLYSLSFPMYLT